MQPSSACRADVMRRGVWENSAFYGCQLFPAPQHWALWCVSLTMPGDSLHHMARLPSVRIAAGDWREGWWVRTIECYVSLSGSAEAINCESFESVFSQVLVRLSRVAKVVDRCGLGTLGFDSCMFRKWSVKQHGDRHHLTWGYGTMWWSWSAGLFRVPASCGNIACSLEHFGVSHRSGLCPVSSLLASSTLARVESLVVVVQVYGFGVLYSYYSSTVLLLGVQ
jgi:hypothetical protein